MERVRTLSKSFFENLKAGILRPALEIVHNDKDLIMELRGSYVSIYYRGNVLLKISECAGSDSESYEFSSHEKFFEEKSKKLKEESGIIDFLEKNVSGIKYRISSIKRSLELEAEQMIVRFNNREEDLNTDYFIVDRQVILGSTGNQIDMIGVQWLGTERARKSKLPLVLFEVKYSHSNIKGISDQLKRYLEAVENSREWLPRHTEELLKQKIELGLITGGSADAIRKLGTEITVSGHPDDIRIVILLVDCNPRSRQSGMEEIDDFPKPERVHVFHLGFGIWQSNEMPKHVIQRR